MLSRICSFGVSGVGGFEVAVEVYISGGLPGFEIVGLPDAAVKEARERVRAAIKNNGFRFPPSRLTVNLAPADRKKAGTLYDLPILVGILAAQGELPRIEEDSAFLGELALDGTLRRISGALPMAIAAERCGVRRLYLPAENAAEAAFAESVEVIPLENVAELVAHLRGEKTIEPAAAPLMDEPQYFKNLETTLRETLINAQRLADETVAEARKKANAILSSAEEQAAALTANAKAEAETTRAESAELKANVEDYRSRFVRLLQEQAKILKSDESLFN